MSFRDSGLARVAALALASASLPALQGCASPQPREAPSTAETQISLSSSAQRLLESLESLERGLEKLGDLHQDYAIFIAPKALLNEEFREGYHAALKHHASVMVEMQTLKSSVIEADARGDMTALTNVSERASIILNSLKRVLEIMEIRSSDPAATIELELPPEFDYVHKLLGQRCVADAPPSQR